MTQKRNPISEGRTFEELQDLLLKVARQMRTMAPPPHIVSSLDRIEAEMTERRKHRRAKLTLVWRQPRV